MNVSLTSITTNTYKKGSVFAGGLPVLQNNGLKSTQEKAERQQKAQNEVAFWEKQKENLKTKECDSVEEIAEKLKALHNYEDEIAAAKDDRMRQKRLARRLQRLRRRWNPRLRKRERKKLSRKLWRQRKTRAYWKICWTRL